MTSLRRSFSYNTIITNLEVQDTDFLDTPTCREYRIIDLLMAVDAIILLDEVAVAVDGVTVVSCRRHTRVNDDHCRRRVRVRKWRRCNYLRGAAVAAVSGVVL